MAVELVSGILVWGGVGYLLDRWLGTSPWLLGLGCFVGNGAGLYLMWLRSSGRFEGGDGRARRIAVSGQSEGVGDGED